MTTPEPMTPERLAEIKELASQAAHLGKRYPALTVLHTRAVEMDIPDLVAEVYRLQAENKRIEERDAQHRHERLGCCSGQ